MNNNFADWNPLGENQNNVNSNIPTSPNNMVSQDTTEILDSTISMPAVGGQTEILDATTSIPVVQQQHNVTMINPTLPNTNEIKANTISSNVRYNPVTGQEESLEQIMQDANKKNDSYNADEKLKKVQVEYKPTSTFSSILLFLFFVFLVAFVYFLPEIQVKVENYLHGNIEPEVEVITTGKLVCTLDTNTVNLNRKIERVFAFEENQLKSATFVTNVRGDIVLDEEALDELNNQCQKVRENVSGYDGVTIHCSYNAGELEEKEVFDYQVLSLEDVSNAYFDAGASFVELEYDQSIDQVMTMMRQGGFTCNKEK